MERLKAYPDYIAECANIPIQIKELEESSISVKSTTFDAAAIKTTYCGGREEAIIRNMSKREDLSQRLEIIKRELAVTDKALKHLAPEEYKILHHFYIARVKGHVEKLCEELYIERSRVYKLKDEALRRFTLICYGAVET